MNRRGILGGLVASLLMGAGFTKLANAAPVLDEAAFKRDIMRTIQSYYFELNDRVTHKKIESDLKRLCMDYNVPYSAVGCYSSDQHTVNAYIYSIKNDVDSMFYFVEFGPKGSSLIEHPAGLRRGIIKSNMAY